MKTVQIGVTPSVGATFLPVLLETAAGFDPEVDWQVQQTISVTLVEMLGRGDIHAALCYLKVTSALVRSMKLYSEEMLLIGRHEVLGEDNGDIAFADLVRFKFVLDPKINPRRQLVDAAMARTGTELQMQAEIEPVSAKRILVRDKGLCAILPRHLFAPELADGSCTARRIVSPRLPLTLYLLLGKGIDGRLSAFIRSSSAAAAARMVKSRPS
jgi:DNA-binding transcriptional LysR family regulator